jgi:hypothetical protein
MPADPSNKTASFRAPRASHPTHRRCQSVSKPPASPAISTGGKAVVPVGLPSWAARKHGLPHPFQLRLFAGGAFRAHPRAPRSVKNADRAPPRPSARQPVIEPRAGCSGAMAAASFSARPSSNGQDRPSCAAPGRKLTARHTSRGWSSSSRPSRLAFEWIRVLFRCWRDRVRYDESRYLAARKNLRALPPDLLAVHLRA